VRKGYDLVPFSIPLPKIIQGGMGVAISNWRLARAVAQAGQLGVVSGVGLSRVLISRLMDGDPGEHMRRALQSFPFPAVVRDILRRYYIPGGKPADAPYKVPPAYTIRPSRFLDQLTTIANYVEVWLAKEGHRGIVGINLLEKVQMPNLASLYGAMLAGVDYIIMGAGIPTQVAGILDSLAHHQPVAYRLDLPGGAPESDVRIPYDPESVFPGLPQSVGPLQRPQFLPIISSPVLAQALLKRSTGSIQGFVVEAPIAGGHNAPPRGPLKLNDQGEPIYGPRDAIDAAKMRDIGLPFWLAGGYAYPHRLQEALDAGAAGVQVGTAFALCDESGLDEPLKASLLGQLLNGGASVRTSAVVSPTGFPFKVAQLAGTLSDETLYTARPRVCDLGFLRTLYTKPDGSLGYRCPAEPVEAYVSKGGNAQDTVGRGCLCNNLFATAGYPQRRPDGYIERPLVTTGNDLATVQQFIQPTQTRYSAQDVIRHLLGC
jgi:nitronate monooxygenase